MITSSQLTELIRELHQANQELAEAAVPLKQHIDLDLAQRQNIGDELRAGLSRWERVTQRINDLLQERPRP